MGNQLSLRSSKVSSRIYTFLVATDTASLWQQHGRTVVDDILRTFYVEDYKYRVLFLKIFTFTYTPVTVAKDSL